VILFLTNADTELLCLRTLAEGLPDDLGPLRAGNPQRLDGVPSVDGVDLVVVRLLGGRRSWQEPFDRLQSACADASVPLLAFGGEAHLDRELAEASSVPLPTLLGAFDYLEKHLGLTTDSQQRDWMREQGGVPAARMGRADEIASLIVYLCSEQAGYITGSWIEVDGGHPRSAF